MILENFANKVFSILFNRSNSYSDKRSLEEAKYLEKEAIAIYEAIVMGKIL